ncbi:putative cytoplasmic protein [Trichodelitschia bisporula]|uniref:Putative cytoplasmic protein n=1 Tax=Trichodelitschia bisporula TaxID=703511 RepID=A0A6G1HMP4_9PEZI|nr:putative cytoplasmic protein [Trichodelitschia bisporula]
MTEPAPDLLTSTIDRLITNLITITDDTGHFLLHLSDGRVIDTKGWNGWEWTHGIGLWGLYAYHELRPDAAVQPLSIIEAWFKKQLPQGTTKNINTMSPFLTLASLPLTPESMATLGEWAEWAMNTCPRTPAGGWQHVTYLSEHVGQLWADTLVMTALPLAKIGKVLDQPEYVAEAARQFLVHVAFLRDSETGLFFHGWQFNEEGVGGHNFARARWARGNAWVCMAVPEMLRIAGWEEGDAVREWLVSVYRMQCAALRGCQAKSGMWRTILDRPEEEGSYEESSATAGIAYGILKGVDMGLLDRTFLPVVGRAVKGVMDKINEGGELEGTSFGTGMGDSLEHYYAIERTSMPYGQALAIMLLAEVLKAIGGVGRMVSVKGRENGQDDK